MPTYYPASDIFRMNHFNCMFEGLGDGQGVHQGGEEGPEVG